MLRVYDVDVDINASRILTGITVDVGAGELVCLVGRNGAGKTTLLRTVMGYLCPHRGRVDFQDICISSLRTHAIARLGIGYSPEMSEVFADLTVEENIRLPTHTRVTSRTAEDRIATAYQVFPQLRPYRHRGGAQLSGGERKMLSIGRALAADPEMLLIDEPFEGLSPAIIPVIGDGIASIRSRGCSILMAESNIAHIPEYADRVYVIERGEIVYAGPLAAALRNTELACMTSRQPDPRAERCTRPAQSS